MLVDLPFGARVHGKPKFTERQLPVTHRRKARPRWKTAARNSIFVISFAQYSVMCSWEPTLQYDRKVTMHVATVVSEWDKIWLWAYQPQPPATRCSRSAMNSSIISQNEQKGLLRMRHSNLWLLTKSQPSDTIRHFMFHPKPIWVCHVLGRPSNDTLLAQSTIHS